MTEIIAFGSDCPITVVDREESGPGASVSTEKDASVSKRKLIDWPPTVTDTQGFSHVIGSGVCVGTPGNLQSLIDCPESPTPGAYTSGGILYSKVFLHGQRGSQGQLRCLRATSLEMPFLSTIIASSSLFTWVPLGIFLFRLF